MELPELQFDAQQERAFNECVNVANRVAAVTGPAGTGKTTLLRRVHYALTQHGYRVALCSPTGKSAKRIYEATGIDAQTIHKLLEYTHPGEKDKHGKVRGFSFPRRDRANPLEYDVVLADEYAMVNDPVHRSLFDALPAGGVIRLFGDDNQLRPIEEDKRLQGTPSNFIKILENPKFVSVKLDVVFRQGVDSGILLNATNLLRSKVPTNNDQWAMRFTDNPVAALGEFIREQGAVGHDFSLIENQIIVPQNTSWVGTVKLNRMMQGLFHNTEEPCLRVPRHNWAVGDGDKKGEEGGTLKMYVGDKVIFSVNNYDLAIFNGESGRIIEIDPETGEIVVDFGDREQAIPPEQMVTTKYGTQTYIDPRKDLDLAYAITTHKTQGSEYRRVAYIINKSNSYMLSRRNFYTAVTRAREHVTVFCDQQGLQRAVFKRD